ncbi:hypothetical protein [Arenimonas fontis]|uniref:Uncharacterized protein n=1 Tax=Arenimonas fontis TaxID=2608255 RepID=A0A5B2ZBG4_9GAMM|nr:hypothetical protein [Arenimonas fontis]KAA2284482.1 hypothetical protein F0415_09150 [Arenimonas fontis]
MAASSAAGHHADIVRGVVMEYEISLLGRQLPLAAIAEALLAADPAALLDVDGGRALLRLSTCLGSRELRRLLGEAGLAVSECDLRQLPSVCCGGCGG